VLLLVLAVKVGLVYPLLSPFAAMGSRRSSPLGDV
jgi:hypothetical protein